MPLKVQDDLSKSIQTWKPKKHLCHDTQFCLPGVPKKTMSMFEMAITLSKMALEMKSS